MRTTCFTLLLFFVLTSTFSQTKIAGVELPATYQIKDQNLRLNGAGVREKFWMDLYAGGLYVSSKLSSGKEVLNADSPMVIKIHIVSGLISSDKMSSAVEEGFENSTKGHLEELRVKIDKFKSFFSEEINKNDVFDIAYSPADGIMVFKNNKELGHIEGYKFKKALFGIWFGDQPADKDLKEGMLNI
ncbi:chalcone isomerase family protein [Psychroflexus tropicus]|uniref:chalcone isomerase family protein n=1 Tax=Psychroflexus tropicus TaxID=197345 RepID=UPI000373CD8B|nr:chalcone isomerase family protein [Psychroflexus tropicus]